MVSKTMVLGMRGGSTLGDIFQAKFCVIGKTSGKVDVLDSTSARPERVWQAYHALCMTGQKCRAVLGQPRMRLSSACNWQWHGWTILSNASAFVQGGCISAPGNT